VTITFLRWRDATAEEADHGGPVVPALSELEEVGFLLGETEEAVTIGMEHDVAERRAGRWRLHVPKVNILERHDVPLEQLIRRGRRKAVKK